MPSVTATTIITTALKKIGALSAGQSATAADLSDGLASLNTMLESWSLDSLKVPFQTRISHTLDGSRSYTVGPGGDINTVRPTFIVSARVQVTRINYPMTVIRDRGTFDNIYDKRITGIPEFVYYDPSYPLGTLNVWYVGDSTHTLLLNTRGQLAQFPSPSLAIDLAPGYPRALEFNLAIEIAPDYETEPSALVIKTAQESLASIKRLNRENPLMSYDNAIPTRSRTYNIEQG